MFTFHCKCVNFNYDISGQNFHFRVMQFLGLSLINADPTHQVLLNNIFPGFSYAMICW